jgi:Protein of unknown function (DUF3095)
MEMSDEQFFASLPEVTTFGAVVDPRSYAQAPHASHLVVTDVRGSTRAIEAGRYKDVNALGAASIIALRNAIGDLEIPYVFGGDGATMLVPGTHLLRAETALRGVRRIARDAFSLDLRIGVVAVSELAASGHAVRVARYRISPGVCLGMFSGSGIATAERWIKDSGQAERFHLGEGESEANLEGFECRWQPVPSRRGKVVSIIVSAAACADDERAVVYRRVLAAIEDVCDPEAARPVSEGGLRFATPFSDFSTEARLRATSSKGIEFDRARRTASKKALIGRVLVALRAQAGGFDGRSYRRELVRNTDFRKFDDTLRMVLDLSMTELEALIRALETERAAGTLFYGARGAPSALVTCFVRSYAGDHVHFVDGADGGYALAAKQMKQQMAAGRI